MLRFRNDRNVPWEVTEGKAAVKIMSWKKIREINHVEDPLQEIAAMQHVSRDGVHPHVMGVYDVLEDEDYLLMFMPFCSAGDLFGYVSEAGRFSEEMARFWFKQLIEVREMLPISPHLVFRPFLTNLSTKGTVASAKDGSMPS